MSASKHRDYFLGSLDEAASAEIELRVLEDADFAAELAGVEEDLIEDYIDGTLPSGDAELFRSKYLVTDERIKSVEMTALMKRFARQSASKPAAISESQEREDVGFFNWFGSLALGVRIATASLALIVVVTSLWFVLRSPRDNELLALQNRYEKINQDPNTVSLDTKLTEFTLVSGNLRASGSAFELSRTDLTEDVRFRIAVPPQTDDSTNYNIAIFRDSTEVFRQNKIRPVVNATGAELRLLLPRQIFTAGNYRINLTSEKAPDLNYYFVVR